MTLTPLMIATMAISIPLIILLIAGLFLDKSGGKKGKVWNSSRYTTVNLHPILVLVLIFAIPCLIAYLAWLLTKSAAIMIAAPIGIPLIIINIIRLFATKSVAEKKSAGAKDASEEDHLPQAGR